MDEIDEIKVHVVVALCEELRSLVPNNPRYALIADKLESRWRALSATEQDAVDQILAKRNLPAAQQMQRTNGSP